MAEFLNSKNGQTWQSIPVAVFYTKNLEYLYHYTEYPAIYHKDRVVGRSARRAPGRTRMTPAPGRPRVHGAAAVAVLSACGRRPAADEILSALHERFARRLASAEGPGGRGGVYSVRIQALWRKGS